MLLIRHFNPKLELLIRPSELFYLFELFISLSEQRNIPFYVAFLRRRRINEYIEVYQYKLL